MNELQLSKDLNVITAEIQSYKQIAGQSIFEIGRRLKHVKENDLVHGEFGKWLETIDFNQSQASRFIKVYEELGDTNLLTSAKVGFRNLLEIATLPEEEREKEHVTSKGETKTVDEMTVRELQEVKRKLKQAESQAELERKERERLEKELENIEPEKIEVVPDDYDFYKGNYESAVSLQKRYKEQMEEMRKELNDIHGELERQPKANIDKTELNRLKEEEERIKRRLDSYEKMHNIQTLFENTMAEVIKVNKRLHIDTGVDLWKIEEYESCLNDVIDLCEKLKKGLPDQNIIEGEIVND